MADLYIRWSLANPRDDGVRPLMQCWPPNAVWTNASISMSYPPNHPDPLKRDTTAYDARIDEEVLIHVHVYTTGASFRWPSPELLTPITCQVWACTGANGVGPISALASSNGAAGMEDIVHGYVDTPDFYGVAYFLWKPTAADGLVFDASGAAHICLAANLYYPRPSTETPRGQGQKLPVVLNGQQVQTVFPCGDGPIDPRSAVPIGHFQGQKNIRVLPAAAPNLVSELQVNALDGQEGIHVLELSERGGRAALDSTIREHLLAHPAVDLMGGRPRRQRTMVITPERLEILAPVLGEEVLRAGLLPLEPAERARLAGGGELVLAEDEDIRLRPGRPLEDIAVEWRSSARGRSIEVETVPDRPERVTVELSGAKEDPPGTVRVFDLVERNRKGKVVGGTTFVTVAFAQARSLG